VQEGGCRWEQRLEGVHRRAYTGDEQVVCKEVSKGERKGVRTKECLRLQKTSDQEEGAGHLAPCCTPLPELLTPSLEH